MLVTTHYLDEAEHCHRIAIIQAGTPRRASARSRAEARSSRRGRFSKSARRAGRRDGALDAHAGSREDQHLRHRRARRAARRRCRRRTAIAARCAAQASRDGVAAASSRRSRTSSSTSPSGRRHEPMRKTLAVGTQGAAADRPRSADAADPAVRAGVLPAGLRLRAELRHPPCPPGRAGRRSQRGEPRADLGVRQFRLLRPRRRRHGRRRRSSTRCSIANDVPGGAGHSRAASAATSPAGSATSVQVIINGDNANTATTVMGYAMGVLSATSARTSEPARVRDAAWPVCQRRAARLVQPRASQHAVPRARAHRLYRDAHRRRLHRAVDRSREGGGHDGAGAHGADRRRAVHRRQDGAVLRRLAHLGA